MALNPETEFAGKIAAASAAYPYGQARNITSPGDGTGTPWIASLINDIFGFQQSLLSAAAIVPTNSPDEVGASQYLDALNRTGWRNWDTNTTYAIGEKVIGSDGYLYQAVLSQAGNDPVGDGGTNWDFADFKVKDLIVGDAAADTVTFNAEDVTITTELDFENGQWLIASGGDVSSTGGLTIGSASSSAIFNLGDTGGNFYGQIIQDAATTGRVRYNSYANSGSSAGHQFEINAVKYAEIDASGAFKASTDGTFSAAAGVHELVNTNAGFGTLISNENTGASGIGLRVDLGGGGSPTGKICTFFAGGGEQAYVEADGDILNTNGTYGTISDRRLKDLKALVSSDRYFDRFLKIQFHIYTLLADPTNQKLLGVVAQELKEVFPGLVKERKNFKTVVKTRKVKKFVPVTRTITVKEPQVIIDPVTGFAVMSEILVEKTKPVFKQHPLVDTDGKRMLGKDGAPLFHSVPEVKEVEEAEKYEVQEEADGVTLTVKTSILQTIAMTVVQELQKRVLKLEKRVLKLEGAQ